MTDSLTGIIKQLERQKTAIERALAALREVEGIPATAAPARISRHAGSARPQRQETQRCRPKADEAGATAAMGQDPGRVRVAAPATPEPPKPKRRISAEGMKRIIAATKKRWRLQRAAAKSAPAKKVAPKR